MRCVALRGAVLSAGLQTKVRSRNPFPRGAVQRVVRSLCSGARARQTGQRFARSLAVAPRVHLIYIKERAARSLIFVYYSFIDVIFKLQ